MSEQAAQLPAGTTLWHCPLCDWAHAMPPVTLDAVVGNPYAVEALDTQFLTVEAAVEAHLGTHPLIEWVRTVQEQREILAAFRKVYDDGDAAIRHLATCDWCSPIGYDRALCNEYFAACRGDGPSHE